MSPTGQVPQLAKERGELAEHLACELLEGQGYCIKERNFRAPGGEIDIVAQDGAVLVFVEVRSRANSDYGDPLETISQKKVMRITKAARAYLAELVGAWPEMRFDVVGIIWSNPPQVTLIKDAFEAH